MSVFLFSRVSTAQGSGKVIDLLHAVPTGPVTGVKVRIDSQVHEFSVDEVQVTGDTWEEGTAATGLNLNQFHDPDHTAFGHAWQDMEDHQARF